MKNEEIGQYFFLCEGHHLFLQFIFEICIQVLSDNILRTLVTSPTYLPLALKCLLCSLLTKLLFLGRKVGGGGVRVEGLEGCSVSFASVPRIVLQVFLSTFFFPIDFTERRP